MLDFYHPLTPPVPVAQRAVPMNASESVRPAFWKQGPVRASVAAWFLVIAGIVSERALGGEAWAWVLYAGSIAFGAAYFAREAVRDLIREREVGIELLMTVAIVAAAALGRWQEAALVACLYSVAEAIEGFTVRRTRHAISDLMDLVPPKARVLRDGREAEVDVAEVRIGERFRVRPGEAIPVDGVIAEGISSIDESAITGEAMPAERGPGAAVFGGTLNGNGSLLVEATKAFQDNVVSKIIELVERAQGQKGRSQLFIEKFGRIYSPAVLGVSALIAFVPWLLGWDGVVWAHKAIGFLVAASPCALAVATPVTLAAAIGSAARQGILLKGGMVVEDLGKVRAIALDKTGTITSGRPAVTGIYSPDGQDADVLLVAAAVEHHSEHPLARAIVEEAVRTKIEVPEADGFQAMTGVGVKATVLGRQISVLKPSAAERDGVLLSATAREWLKGAEDRGESAVIVTDNGKFKGLIAVADTVRDAARGLVDALRNEGIDHVVMLTGDNVGTARAIASRVGIDEYHAALMPEDKVARVAELRNRFGAAAMVGDGINDAPALAAASVGIAMGTRGSDAALAAADVALVGDDLSKLPWVIRLARRSRRVIQQNIAMSLIIVVALVAGTFFANLSMLGAVIGHEGSEVLIVLNGLRVALRSKARPVPA